jgi:16S rRNA C1402 (ribose-2'-O) methylase RsmI
VSETITSFDSHKQTNKQQQKERRKKEDWYFIMRYASRRNSRLLLPYRKGCSKIFFCIVVALTKVHPSLRHRDTVKKKMKEKKGDTTKKPATRCLKFKTKMFHFFVVI